MLHSLSLKFKTYFTTIVLILVAIYLAWDYHDGSFDKHYLLHDENLPGFSNLWGIFLIPLVTWLALTILNSFILAKKAEKAGSIAMKFFLAILFGVIISISFRMENDNISASMMLGAIGLSLFIPLYRPEYILGFILSMIVVFGCVLPVIVASVLLVMFLITSGVRFLLLKTIKRVKT